MPVNKKYAYLYKPIHHSLTFKRKTLTEALVEAHKAKTKRQWATAKRQAAKGLEAAFTSTESAGSFFHPVGTHHNNAFRLEDDDE